MANVVVEVHRSSFPMHALKLTIVHSSEEFGAREIDTSELLEYMNTVSEHSSKFDVPLSSKGLFVRPLLRITVN